VSGSDIKVHCRSLSPPFGIEYGIGERLAVVGGADRCLPYGHVEQVDLVRAGFGVEAKDRLVGTAPRFTGARVGGRLSGESFALSRRIRGDLLGPALWVDGRLELD
jgi:hypothetical protein